MAEHERMFQKDLVNDIVSYLLHSRTVNQKTVFVSAQKSHSSFFLCLIILMSLAFVLLVNWLFWRHP